MRKVGAVQTFALDQLRLIANVLIPEEAETLIGRCGMVPKPTYDQMAAKKPRMSELDLIEMRTAEAQAKGKLQMTETAATSKDANSTSATALDAADQSQTSGTATGSGEEKIAPVGKSPVGAIQGADEKAVVGIKPATSPSVMYEPNTLVPEVLQRSVQVWTCMSILMTSSAEHVWLAVTYGLLSA